MKYLKLSILLILLSTFTGCAHHIDITPDISMIKRSDNADKISGNVGYYFSQSSKEKEVITPAGGGDRVRYKPYSDIEMAFSKMLGNVFKKVTVLESANVAEIKEKSVDYLIFLDISTNSSSPSPFTWPPTWFSVDLESTISDTVGNNLTNISVNGEGNASYSEFLFSHGIAGKRANIDALLKMQTSLINSQELRTSKKQENVSNAQLVSTYKINTETISEVKTPEVKIPINNEVEKININQQNDTTGRLKKLQELHVLGLITSEEFNSKRSKIIDDL